MTSSTPEDKHQITETQLWMNDARIEPSKREILREAFREMGATGCLAFVLLGAFAVILFSIPLRARLFPDSGYYLAQMLISFIPAIAGVVLMVVTASKLVTHRYGEIDWNSDGPRWTVEATIGPVSTDWALRNWDLYLAKEAIFAVPIGIGAALALGVNAGLGDVEAMKEYYPEPVVPEIVDSGNLKWRRYPVDQLERIVVKKRGFRTDEIQLIRQGPRKPDIYGILNRSETNGYRKALRHLYKDIYYEERFRD
jgi:hypothetical protein